MKTTRTNLMNLTIILTNVPIGNTPNSKSTVQMMRQGGPLGKEDWKQVFSGLSKGDIVDFELTSLEEHPFTGLERIKFKVEEVNKTGSNLGGVARVDRVTTIKLDFISARIDSSIFEEHEPSVADTLRRTWSIV